jgi:hypothetical protein
VKLNHGPHSSLYSASLHLSLSSFGPLISFGPLFIRASLHSILSSFELLLPRVSCRAFRCNAAGRHWNPPTDLVLAPGQSITYGMRFSAAAGGPRTRDDVRSSPLPGSQHPLATNTLRNNCRKLEMMHSAVVFDASPCH